MIQKLYQKKATLTNSFHIFYLRKAEWCVSEYGRGTKEVTLLRPFPIKNRISAELFIDKKYSSHKPGTGLEIKGKKKLLLTAKLAH